MERGIENISLLNLHQKANQVTKKIEQLSVTPMNLELEFNFHDVNALLLFIGIK